MCGSAISGIHTRTHMGYMYTAKTNNLNQKHVFRKNIFIRIHIVVQNAQHQRFYQRRVILLIIIYQVNEI